MKNFSKIFSTVFAVGYIKYAPGTFGTIVAGLIYYLMPECYFQGSNQLYLTGFLILLSLFSVWMTSEAEKYLGHDAGCIVIDEVLGYFVSILFLPKTLSVGIAAFILFRFFDIAKIEPVNFMQKLPKGWGIVADDLMAGIYANLILQIIYYFKPELII